METQAALITQLRTAGVLRTPEIIGAFTEIDRKDFVRPEDQDAAYEDRPLLIGCGQTISQPYTVAFMLEELEPRPGHHILDVGSGSGWTTALLGRIVGKGGDVVGTEIVPELASFGQENLAKYPELNATIKEAGDTFGAPDDAPFDRILVSAGNTELPQELVEQLKIGGVMVIPVGTAIWKIIKTSETEFETEKHEGFAFVPLIR